jgi:excisionase family DNA binding protein
MSSQQSTPFASGRLIDLPGLCNWLGLSERQVRELVAKKRIPVTKIDGRLRFDINAIDRWLAKSTTPGRAA